MRIRFLSEQTYDTGGPGFGAIFPAGYVLDQSAVATALRVPVVSDDYAVSFLQRWVRRGVARIVKDNVPASKARILHRRRA